MTATDPDGTVAGAVYKPLLEIVPAVEFPPATSFTLQMTFTFELPETVAVNCWVCETPTDGFTGDIDIVIPGMIVAAACPDLPELLAEAAPIVIVAGEGTVAGAAYKPLEEIVPSVAFPPATPFTLQTTLAEPGPATEN